MLEALCMRHAVSHWQAAGLALLGYTLWVLCDVCLKFAGASSVPRLELVAMAGLAAALLVAIGQMVRGEMRTLWPRRPLPQVGRALLDLGNNVCVLVALQHMSLSMFYIVIFLSPLVASLLARMWLREALRWQQMLALAVGFLGVAVAVDPFAAVHPADRTGYGACAVCVLCFSTNMVWSRRMTQTESTGSMTFFSGVVIAAVAGLGTMEHVQMVPLRMTAVVAGVAFFGVLGNLCFFFALRSARTAFVSQFHYSQLPMGALLGFAIWRELPTPLMGAGAVLIVAAGLYTAMSTRDERRGVALAAA